MKFFHAYNAETAIFVYVLNFTGQAQKTFWAESLETKTSDMSYLGFVGKLSLFFFLLRLAKQAPKNA